MSAPSITTIFTIALILECIIAIGVLLIPGFIAFKRQHKYRWVILILGVVPLYWISWVAALIWAVWPKAQKEIVDPN